MDSIYDNLVHLSIGSLVDCKFGNGEIRQLFISGLDAREPQKIYVGIPEDIKSSLVETLPSLISESLLLKTGFTEDEWERTQIVTQYSIALRKGMRLHVRNVPQLENRFNVYLSVKPITESNPDDIIHIGRCQYFYKIQDLYRTFSSKLLIWMK